MRVRFVGMRSVTRSVTVSAPVSATRVVAGHAEHLVRTALRDRLDQVEITLLAISVSHLVNEHALQLELPLDTGDPTGERLRPGTETGAARWAVDRAVDAICDRLGPDC